MEFSIVVPVCNEAGNVLPLLREIHSAAVDCGTFEVVYVDDGSSDATADELQQARDRYPHLRVLRHRQCCGQSSALLTGIGAARSPLIVTLDGDGQNDPADVPLLLQRYRAAQQDSQPLMLIGYRTRRRDSRWRHWSSRVANGVRSRLLRDATPDSGCGLKLFPRDLFLALPAFDHMHRFLPALMLRAGARVESIPVHHRQRQRGRSKYGLHNRLWAGLVDMAGVMWLQRRKLGEGVASAGALARLADSLGVYWLKRRPCNSLVEEL